MTSHSGNLTLKHWQSSLERAPFFKSLEQGKVSRQLLPRTQCRKSFTSIKTGDQRAQKQRRSSINEWRESNLLTPFDGVVLKDRRSGRIAQPQRRRALISAFQDTDCEEIDLDLELDINTEEPFEEQLQLQAAGVLPQEESSRLVLLHLQVQSAEQQELLAAAPAHPEALYGLYASYVLSCFFEKVWRFALPALLSLVLDSLQPVAIVSFVGQFIIFAGGPIIGGFMDSAPRILAFNCLSIVQVCAMLSSSLATIYALSVGINRTLQGLELLNQPWFLVVVLGGAVERLMGLAAGVAFERDWVVQLAGPTRHIALSKANSILRRVDLVCEIAGPLAFGWLLSNFEPIFCLKASVAITLATLPTLLCLVRLTDKLSKGVLHKLRHNSSIPAPKNGETENSQACPTGRQDFRAIVVEVVRGWKLYLGQAVLPASLAYVLLSCNAVLSPGSLMTSFLTQRGVDMSAVGLFRGACAAIGFAATFVSTPLISHLGILQAGASSLLFQAVTLAMSVLVYMATPPPSSGRGETHLLIFLTLVAVSRLGHWAYDVIDAQILQTAIPTSQANVIGTTEMALSSLGELLMLGLAIVVHDSAHFAFIAGASMASIFAAAAVYVHWLSRSCATRERMFPASA
eukprot:TRINITY_DN15615_c0_g1_i1.p1 TRINITY_DN15615_c0_g1~~TRINITY_DN15615_c0_g1_i1.p1  ORF type:complete len:630 (-),score=124.72 TRINITY_DN15615_c0_g1_i1:222-2111(-)